MSRQYFSTGTAAPTVTPSFNGEIFVDTTNDLIYFSVGTASSSEWVTLPTALSDLSIDTDLAMGGLYKIKKALGMDFQTALELTVASGVITQSQSHHTIDTQADAAADDLDTITIAADMSMLLVTLENAARIVTLKHGTGNMNLPDDADIVMAENTVYFLLYTGSAWNLVGESGAQIKAQDQTGTSYQVTAADWNGAGTKNTTIFMNNASPMVLTLALTATEAHATDQIIDVVREGAGTLTITSVTGVDLNGTDANSIVVNNQFQAVSIMIRGADDMLAIGDYT